jgi:SAM-dependent methyltransferase
MDATTSRILASYPRARPPLPDAIKAIYEKEYLLNRSGRGLLYRTLVELEAWEHRQIASERRPGPRLELGAGTLNHLVHENDGSSPYDVVEPNEFFYRDSPNKSAIRTYYDDISEPIQEGLSYGRIYSVGVLEHLDDLPVVLAQSGTLLNEHGLFQCGLPSEGGFLWGIGWRLTTAIAFRWRTGQKYKHFMRHEHINESPEMVTLIRHFFADVRIVYFPLPFLNGSFYTFVAAQNPRRDVCRAYLQQRGKWIEPGSGQ